MRIIAGTLKNRKLHTPKRMLVRPTSSKIRESVFNMLQNKIEGSTFLDLFAGSGAMGFEALSRGSDQVVFVDKNREAVECIEKNILLFNVQDRTSLIKGDVLRILDGLEKREKRFDIIYVDPPYAESFQGEPLSGRVLERIDRGDFLREDGTLIIEEGHGASLINGPLRTLKLVSERKFGGTRLYILTHLTHRGWHLD